MATDDTLVDALALTTPSEFHAFPYEKPYDIQIDLMRHLYTSIESRSLAIIESPTGTGKTLSLLTAALTWLHDDKDRAKKGQLDALKRSLKEKSGATEPAWVIEQSLARQKRLLDEDDDAFSERLENARKREEIIRRREKGRVIKKARGEPETIKRLKGDEEDQFLPDEGDADDDDDDDLLENMSLEVREQIKKMKGKKPGGRFGRLGDDTEGEDPICTKIFFVSRTHTQLTQAVSELRRIRLPPQPSTSSSAEDDETKPRAQTRSVPLGSRKNLCINDELIASLRKDRRPSDKENAPLEVKEANGAALDEACRELNTRPKESRCPYLPGIDEESRLLDFRDHTLSSPRDIEDLASLGRELKTCPYYGGRKAINRAELVTLPYNLLLQKTTREALGIDLKGHIIIIDEAHNLIDTVLSIHSHTLSSTLLQLSLAQLKAYYTRFRTRLTPKHELQLRHLVLFITALAGFCKSFAAGSISPSASSTAGDGASKSAPASAKTPSNTPPKANDDTVMMTVGDLVARLGAKVDGVNLIETVQYLRESKLARKITGYCDHVLLQQLSGSAKPGPQPTSKERKGMTPPLHAVEAFLLILVDPNHHGRIFVEKSPAPAPPPVPTLAPTSRPVFNAGGKKANTKPQPQHLPHSQAREEVVTLKYQLLNPEDAFRDVVQDARSVILAGGTMTPMSDFNTQLFSYLPEERVKAFSCGHVIPAKNLQTLILTQGPRKNDLLWKFDRRGNKDMTEELGQMLVNIATIVPNGLVVFFPSYAFLDQARATWEVSGLLIRLGAKKAVYFEPRESSEVESVLRAYADSARESSRGEPPAGQPSPRGALLFAVVGGKVSEGLNFTDELARAVVVVGLPFANLGSRELQERMRFVRERTGAQGKKGDRDAGTELYENMCMKAVNQSIGRAIRHQGDWASLILIDQRYSTSRVQSKLPNWIRGDIRVAKTWGEGLKEMGAFYRARRTTATDTRVA